ncbi:hypothetical protein D3Z36_15970 [Lachnospiraceae bacterium]|nr:hypothetical protein [Lachnospiraceae bacterium]
MKTVDMIRELRREAEKHKSDKVFTGQTNISVMCADVADKLEENLKALIKVNDNIDDLIDVAHETSLKFEGESKARLEGRVSAFWEVKSMIENLLAD